MYSDHFSFKDTCYRFDQLFNASLSGASIDECLTIPYGIFSELSDVQLESLAQRARSITRQRFGNMIRLFIPLYLSNECYNKCSYCGFSYDHDIDRYTLTDDEIDANVDVIINKGFQRKT